MIWQLIRALRDGTPGDVMGELLVRFAAMSFVIIFCLSVHECAHAWAAKKLGDNTAWMHGRLTLNPSKHLDLIGTLMILFAGFGYAKPVPVNPRNFKNRKRGMALTAAAGPASNLLMAVLFCLLAYTVCAIDGEAQNDLLTLLWKFFFAIFQSNVMLMVFNLIPFPPLDGSRILDLLLPAKASDFLADHEHILRWAVFGLLIFSSPIGWLGGLVSKGINALVALPFPYTITIY